MGIFEKRSREHGKRSVLSEGYAPGRRYIKSKDAEAHVPLYSRKNMTMWVEWGEQERERWKIRRQR